MSSTRTAADAASRASAANDSESSVRATIALFARYLRPHRGAFRVTCGASAANKVLDLMPPVLVGWVIDTVTSQPPRWLQWAAAQIWPGMELAAEGASWSEDTLLAMAAILGVLAALVFLFESITQWAYQLGFMRIAQQVQHALRLEAYNAIQSREIEFFENHRMGETMTMLNDDVNQLERFLNSGFNDLLQLAVLFIFTGIALFGISWQLALAGLTPIPVILWGSLKYQKMIAPRYRRVRQSVGELNSRLENNIGGIAVIKSFTAENFESSRVSEASREYQRANFEAIKLASLYVPLIRMAVAIGFAAVLWYGSYLALGPQAITFGELTLFAMLIQRVLWPLTRLGATLDEFERARASARRTRSLLYAPAGIRDPENPVPLDRARGELELQHVSFAYANGLPVLHDLSLQLRAGETVGVAGATGAGKSSLVKLLLRLYDPTEGATLLDGIDVRNLRQADLRKNIALVSQDVYLFHGTIAENIAYGLSGQVSGADIEEAARIAKLHDFVQTLPDGYDSIVGEKGVKLSGGQRQRLSIARAILKDAPIMIFDEATSSVDTETEKAIQENLSAFTAGKTALVIAHRLSTIRGADRIIVLEQGRIAEEGAHDELLRRGGVYADLWAVQSGERMLGS